MRRNSAFVLCLIAINKILETPSKAARNCKEGGIALRLNWPCFSTQGKKEEEEEKKCKKKNIVYSR